MRNRRRKSINKFQGGAAMGDFLTALGLVLVIEGVLYGGFPGLARRMAQQMNELPEQTIRLAGIGAAIGGLLIVWLVRG